MSAKVSAVVSFQKEKRQGCPSWNEMTTKTLADISCLVLSF